MPCSLIAWHFFCQQRVHLNKMKTYTELINSHRKRKASSSTEPPMKNAKLTDSLTGSRRATQATFDKLVLTFVCEANQPFSVVETTSFKTVMETLQPQCTVMTRKTLQRTWRAFGLKALCCEKLRFGNFCFLCLNLLFCKDVIYFYSFFKFYYLKYQNSHIILYICLSDYIMSKKNKSDIPIKQLLSTWVVFSPNTSLLGV